MPRYFLEVAYRGTRYSGFQIQENANTIQSEIEKAFAVLQRTSVTMTGSSRTDSGVHALQNYFHFDLEGALHPEFVYKMNAILPADIVVRRVLRVGEGMHARYDAVSREYEYRIHRQKNPFLKGLSLYYPYKLDLIKLEQAASLVIGEHVFFAFAKTNTQVTNFTCTIEWSSWLLEGDRLTYTVRGNRFLRGMVRLLTASMLHVGRGKMELEVFQALLEGNSKCGNSLRADGLFLKAVEYPLEYFTEAFTDVWEK